MLAHFVLRLMLGLGLMLCVMPRREVAFPFFRILNLCLLGFAALHFLTTSGPQVGSVVIGGLAFYGSILWTLGRPRPATLALFLLTGVAATELVLCPPYVAQFRETGLTGGLLLRGVSDLATAGLLGATLTGMLLGHRYLTAPGMPLAPLVRLNQYVGVAAGLRLGVSLVGLSLAWHQLAGQTTWIWLGLRWVAGILGPIVVYFMVRQILKYRNTQAATGVLFVGVIVTFLGELTADLLFHELQLLYELQGLQDVPVPL